MAEQDRSFPSLPSRLKMKASRPYANIVASLHNVLRGPKRISRTFHTSTRLAKIKPFLLPDIGEGITEVQIIQWFVEPEARVEQFDKLCEVQSDKAAAEITSRYDGVIKKLHYDADGMAQVGKPLCDIDVEDSIADEESAPVPVIEQSIFPSSAQQPRTVEQSPERALQRSSGPLDENSASPKSSNASLATPSVRQLLKELNVAIAEVAGTGKDGRILKEDVQMFMKARDIGTGLAALRGPSQRPGGEERAQVDTRQPLTQIQAQMFKTMTRSLSIPHFSYADEISINSLSKIRHRVNLQIPSSHRLSYLPFIIKAVSLALEEFPLLNSRIAPGSENDPHQLIMREKHNVGVAMDTPQGLLVPNIKNVSSLSIMDIAAELSRLKKVAKDGNLSVKDLTGGTITVSNIGAIGGTYVAPVIVSNEVAILGIGKARIAPAFDEQYRVVKREIINFSWSADHRVVDGATMARMAERVRSFVEEPEGMMTRLR